VQEICIKKRNKDGIRYLTDARAQLADASKRVRELQGVIKELEDKIRRGVPFPIRRLASPVITPGAGHSASTQG
jgi:hypothetical protein